MFELKTFQSEAANLISDRYTFFANHRDRPSKGRVPRPFFQVLSALTGGGKTPILAQAVSLIRNHLVGEPIVIWMSKARSVVSQTYGNFDGGKYSPIIDGFKVVMVKDLTPELISDGSAPLLIMTTTGLFNNKDQSEGVLNIYKKGSDRQGEKSIWDRWIERYDGEKRRPLIIVYDEAHNLSDQQTDILSELEAEAYLLASATMRLPDNFRRSVIDPIKLWFKEAHDQDAFVRLKAVDENGNKHLDRFITTAVDSSSVVEAELVKRAIQFDGTTAPMERCLDDLLERMLTIEKEIEDRSMGLAPKSIYVCRTNINDDGTKDEPDLPFNQRKAPPIKIWRYLAETKSINPRKIAIYADLNFKAGSKPESVNLFSKGDDDFDKFHEGDYEHIIFNLSLQEGWDDPACYLAYIDKSMGSNVQVEQVIGRVLRQPGAKHYDNPLLNSAHFFLRVDNRNVFTESLDKVKEKLQSEGCPIVITGSYRFGDGRGSTDIKPRTGKKAKIYNIFIDSTEAQREIGKIVNRFPRFVEGSPDSKGEAETATTVVELTGGKTPEIFWKREGNTNPVRIRWLLNTAIRSITAQALKIVDLKGPRFDARVQVRSSADELIKKTAQEIVDAYFTFSDLAYEVEDEFKFGTIRINLDKAYGFKNGLYPKYSDFNNFELSFARALDVTGVLWHRNPVAGGYRIPLVSPGDTQNFYPDFIAWKGGLIYCLDTKGSHLLTDAVARKLFDIKEGNITKILTRFITEGKQTVMQGKTQKGGYTVWKMKSGVPRPIPVETLKDAVKECFR
jgi:type III restriction enzyme